MVYFLMNFKAWSYKFLKGTKSIPALDVGKFPCFVNPAESANRGGSSTSPQIFIYI